ncbi:MAG: sugar transferase [Spirochaetota bacterium]
MYALIKRIIDITLSLIALICVSPLFIVIVPILRFTGEGEIFFLQPRVGMHKKIFGLMKFATMLKNSPASGTVTTKDDPRVLPLGKFLRKTKMNELPQILNVFKGDMSLVGPRPLTEEVFRYYPKHAQKCIASVRPGVTGLGSIFFRDEESILAASKKNTMKCYREDILPLKGSLEEWYADNRSIRTDMKIIIATAIVILFPRSNIPLAWFAVRDRIEASSLRSYFIRNKERA